MKYIANSILSMYALLFVWYEVLIGTSIVIILEWISVIIFFDVILFIIINHEEISYNRNQKNIEKYESIKREVLDEYKENIKNYNSKEIFDLKAEINNLTWKVESYKADNQSKTNEITQLRVQLGEKEEELQKYYALVCLDTALICTDCEGQLNPFSLVASESGDTVKNRVLQCNDCQKCYVLSEISFFE